MQEQLPLRPAEFVKIRDGFIAFLKQPAGTPIELIIPQAVLDVMAAAARRGRIRQRVLVTLRVASLLVAIVGAVLGAFVNPGIIGIAILLLGGGAFVWSHDRSKVRREPEIDELVTEPNDPLQSNLRALDDLKHLIANGDVICEERLPDGTLKPLSPRARAAFLADHGSLLVVSRDQSLWQCIPHRPIPMSALWIRLGGRVAPVVVTSRTLLKEPDRILFDQRVEWLLSQADKAGTKAKSFREALQIVVALKRPEFEGITFEEKKERLRQEGLPDSRMEKINAGIYPPFNNFLRTLPMHELP
ncbi:hypothetical protein [Sphingopyxis sp. DBS4]|uniref:hypothetical protein n=1 Tax=Sphingopyxis sp. DBS4 TaxID=2968500 RepID=UPI00214C1BBD|nr:hypothetical protein [Sphingopyxis sp. DBS4]